MQPYEYLIFCDDALAETVEVEEEFANADLLLENLRFYQVLDVVVHCDLILRNVEPTPIDCKPQTIAINSEQTKRIR